MSEVSEQIIEGYQVEALAGEGLLGPVYRATPSGGGGPVALRLLRDELSGLPALQRALEDAAPQLVALSHPGIATILAAGVLAGRCYLVSEWLPDGSLADLLTPGGPGDSPPGLAELLDLVRQAAEALAHAHGLGIMHGDLTPGNLMLRPRSEGGAFQGYSVRLADIGLAPLFERAEIEPAPLSPGALAYALAPERCQGLPIDARSDIYALGAILYAVSTGEPPFPVSGLDSAVYAHVYQPAPSPQRLRPDLPAALAQLILRCLAKDPAERYAGAGDLAAELAQIIAGLAPAAVELGAADKETRRQGDEEGEADLLLPVEGAGPGLGGQAALAAPEPDQAAEAAIGETATVAQVTDLAAQAGAMSAAPAPDEPEPVIQVTDLAAQAAMPSSAPSVKLSGFQLDQLLDEDDLGQRYRGRSAAGEAVIVRLLPAVLSGDPGFRADFQLLAPGLLSLRHPALAATLAAGLDAGRCYVASAPAEGLSLREMLAQCAADSAAWPLDLLLGLVEQAASGLGAAHAQGLTHGGLRPARLACSSAGAVHVYDLGLETLVVGSADEEIAPDRATLTYALAPERCQGLPLSPRSDIYALGVILYEIVAGQPPFTAETLEEAIFQHVYQPLAPLDQAAPSLPAPIAQLITRCLARIPEGRYADGTELAAALATARSQALALPASADEMPGPTGEQPAGKGHEHLAPTNIRSVRTIDSPDSLVGETIAGCRVERFLGASETGLVYRVQHNDLDRALALKLFDPSVADDPGFQAAFDREAPRIATLRHRNLVEFFDIGYHEGLYFMLVEWLPDGTLRNVLQERAQPESTWTLATTLDLARQAADGLAYTHARGFVHGIVKPNNLLLERQEPSAGQPPTWTLKVSDSGLGRIIDTDERESGAIWADSLIYTISPERAQGLTIDARSDIYALGVILYEIATGSPPFEARTLDVAVQKHRDALPTPPSQLAPSLPVELERIIMRCLAKLPEERYQSAADLSMTLQSVLASPALAPSPHVIRSSPPSDVQAAVAQPLTPYVQVLDQYGRTLHSAPLSGDGLAVGRRADNDLVLQGAEVLEHHLQIDWDGQQASVTALGRDGSTLLGETRLAPKRGYVWNSTDTLRLSSYWMRLDLSGEAASPLTAASQPSAADRAEDPTAPAMGRTNGRSSPVPPASEQPAPAAMASHIGVQLEQDLLTITPGRPSMFRVGLSNLGLRVDHLTIVVEGVAESWVQRLPPVQLNPNTQASVTLNINVPEDSESLAGSYPVIIKAHSRENPALIGTASAQWVVLAFQRSSLTMRPKLARGWRRGGYRLAIKNEGNAPARFSTIGEDDEQVLDYRFSPADPLDVAPGASGRIQLNLVAQQIRWLGLAQRYSFTVTVKPQGSGEVLTNLAQFEQRAIFPPWLFPALIALAVAVLAYGLAAPPRLASMPYYRFLNPTATPTRTPLPSPTFAPTATRTPTATTTPTITASPVVPSPTLAPTPPPPTVPPPLPPTSTPTITATPTIVPSPTIGPLCLAGAVVQIEGRAPPLAPLVLYFGPRAVGGGIADAQGRFSIRLDPGSEPPGLYEVTVQVRTTRQVVARLTCIVPTPQPTIGPPPTSPTAVPTPLANDG